MTPLPLVLLGCATLAVLALALVRVALSPDRRMTVHNLVAHPLLELVPELGEAAHERTAPLPDDPLLPFLEQLSDEGGALAPYVLVAPALLIPSLHTDECMAMARAGITHLPDTFQPGTFSMSWGTPPEATADDARGVLIIPAELVQ